MQLCLVDVTLTTGLVCSLVPLLPRKGLQAFLFSGHSESCESLLCTGRKAAGQPRKRHMALECHHSLQVSLASLEGDGVGVLQVGSILPQGTKVLLMLVVPVRKELR